MKTHLSLFPLFTAKYKTRSKLPTPWHFCKIKISNLVIISDPMGELSKISLATPKFFADSTGKSFKIKLATLYFFATPWSICQNCNCRPYVQHLFERLICSNKHFSVVLSRESGGGGKGTGLACGTGAGKGREFIPSSRIPDILFKLEWPKFQAIDFQKIRQIEGS